MLIAPSPDPRFYFSCMFMQQQAVKHDELYLLLSISLTVPLFVELVECFQQHDGCNRIAFYISAFLFFFLAWVKATPMAALTQYIYISL